MISARNNYSVSEMTRQTYIKSTILLILNYLGLRNSATVVLTNMHQLLHVIADPYNLLHAAEST